MNTTVYNAIKEGIIITHTSYIENEIANFEYHNKKNIGKELTNYNAAKVPVVEAFINPKTGRLNHRKVGMAYPKYTYTEEMYNEGLAKVIDKAKAKHTFKIKTNPDDSCSQIVFNNLTEPTDRDIELVYSRFDDRYKDHIVGFKPYFLKNGNNEAPGTWFYMEPIFDEETNKKFWNSYDTYCKAKQEWCDKYGCN